MTIAVTAKEAREYVITTTLPSHGVIDNDKKIVKVIDKYGKHQGLFPNLGVLFHRVLNILTAILFIGTEKKRGKNQAKVLVEAKYFKNDCLKDFYEKFNNKDIKGSDKKEAQIAVKWARSISQQLGSMIVDSYIEVTKSTVETKEQLNEKCVEIFRKNFTEEKINAILEKKPKNLKIDDTKEICQKLVNVFQKEIVIVPTN